MQPPTIIAAAGSGRFPSPVTIALVVAAIGYVLWSRMQGQPLAPKRLLVLPALLIVLGISDLTGSRRQGGADVGFLVGGALLSAALGAARGSTMELFARDGVLWERYRPLSRTNCNANRRRLHTQSHHAQRLGDNDRREAKD